MKKTTILKGKLLNRKELKTINGGIIAAPPCKKYSCPPNQGCRCVEWYGGTTG